jgi:hypothetical protein
MRLAEKEGDRTTNVYEVHQHKIPEAVDSNVNISISPSSRSFLITSVGLHTGYLNTLTIIKEATMIYIDADFDTPRRMGVFMMLTAFHQELLLHYHSVGLSKPYFGPPMSASNQKEKCNKNMNKGKVKQRARKYRCRLPPKFKP